MKWRRLCLSVALFPMSLVWYKRDIHDFKISPVVYWLAVSVYVGINVLVVIVIVRLALPVLHDLYSVIESLLNT